MWQLGRMRDEHQVDDDRNNRDAAREGFLDGATHGVAMVADAFPPGRPDDHNQRVNLLRCRARAQGIVLVRNHGRGEPADAGGQEPREIAVQALGFGLGHRAVLVKAQK